MNPYRHRSADPWKIVGVVVEGWLAWNLADSLKKFHTF
jgi:hypothetical protein